MNNNYENEIAMTAMFLLTLFCVVMGIEGAKDIALLSLGAFAGFLKGKSS